MMQERLLPQSIEAECAVLGSILIDPEAMDLLADFLQAEDFYRDAHRELYQAMKMLYERREPPDFITLCDALERRGILEHVGGANYVNSLVNCVPTSGNVEYYGRIVERTAVLRRLLHASGQIAASVYEENISAEQALERAESLIYGISRRNTDGHILPVGEVFGEFLTWFDRIPEGGAIVGVPSGMHALDAETGGFQKSDLLIFAGRPAMGKTSLALSIALAASGKYQRGVLFFSAEMSRLQLFQRAVAHEAHVNLHRLRMGALTHMERTRVAAEAVNLAELPLYIDDTPGISVASMRSRLRREMRKHPVDLVIVDYLQKLTATDENGKRYTDNYKEVSEIARALKDMAREFDVPVLSLAQLSRAVEGRQSHIPQLSDLRDSGAIEQEADEVAFIYRDDYYNKQSTRPGTADIHIAKNRNGPLAEITLGFAASETRFYNLEETPVAASWTGEQEEVAR